MAEHTSGKAFEPPSFENGDVILRGNFAQIVPGTEICSDVTDLTIHGGNFTNCTPQPTWTVTGGNWSQKEFCANLHPDLVAKGLPAEPEDCPHRSAQHEDVQVSKERYKEMKTAGKPVKTKKIKDKDFPDDSDLDEIEYIVEEYVYRDVTR